MHIGSRFRFLVLTSLLGLGLLAGAVWEAGAATPRVLVYTKNQVGPGLYVHDNIAASAAALQKLGKDNGFDVEVSDDPASFTPENLKKFRAIVFDNTNNEILNTEEQKAAFQSFIRGGGGVVGIHSATGSMRKWPYFWQVMGGKFSRHAKMQKFTLLVKDAKDPSAKHLPAKFEWTDEFYYVDNIPDGRHVVLAGDLQALDDPGKDKFPGKAFGDEYPLAWRQSFDGGRQFYTSLGHKIEHYFDPRLMQHILGGLKWVMGDDK